MILFSNEVFSLGKIKESRGKFQNELFSLGKRLKTLFQNVKLSSRREKILHFGIFLQERENFTFWNSLLGKENFTFWNKSSKM